MVQRYKEKIEEEKISISNCDPKFQYSWINESRVRIELYERFILDLVDLDRGLLYG